MQYHLIFSTTTNGGDDDNKDKMNVDKGTELELDMELGQGRRKVSLLPEFQGIKEQNLAASIGHS